MKIPQHLDPYDIVSWRVAMIFAGAGALLLLSILYRGCSMLLWELKKGLGVKSVTLMADKKRNRAEILHNIHGIVTHPKMQRSLGHLQ